MSDGRNLSSVNAPNGAGVRWVRAMVESLACVVAFLPDAGSAFRVQSSTNIATVTRASLAGSSTASRRRASSSLAGANPTTSSSSPDGRNGAPIHHRRSRHPNAKTALRLYRMFLSIPGNPLLALLPELTGHGLMCFCAPDQPCHADVLLEAANP